MRRRRRSGRTDALQDWDGWVREGLPDAVMPMTSHQQPTDDGARTVWQTPRDADWGTPEP